MARIIYLLVLTILLNSYLLSQSEFLKRGQSGFMATCGIGLNKETAKYNVTAGYSYKGFIDLDVNYSKANKGRVTDAVITPTLTYFFIKQGDYRRAPSLGVSVGYNQYKYVTKDIISIPNPLGVGKDTVYVNERNIKAYRLGFTAHRKVAKWRFIYYQPFVNSTFSFHSHGWNFILQSGIISGMKWKNGLQLFIIPALDIESSLLAISLNVGIVY